MKTTTIIPLIAASSLSLLFSSCDSKQEEAREKAVEQKADNMDATAKQVRKNGKTDAEIKKDEADATRKTTEKQADQIEKDADKVREQK